MRTGEIVRILILAATLSAAARSFAGTTENWNVASGDFSAGSNWDSSFAPQTGDTAYVRNGGASTLSSIYPNIPAAVIVGSGSGSSSAGTLTIASGGSLATGSMTLGQSGARGALVLSGGTLLAPQIVQGSGGVGTASIVYFDGGTLEASGNSNLFLSGLTAVYLRSGGAVINTNGHSDRVSQVFAPDPALGTAHDGGLLKTGGGTLTLIAKNTYTGPTVVNGGVLILTTSSALPTGSSLTVGNPALFAAPTVPESAIDVLPSAESPCEAAGSAVVSVPEPGTLVLVAAGLCCLAAACLRGRRDPVLTSDFRLTNSELRPPTLGV